MANITPEEMKSRIQSCRDDLIRTRARDMLIIGLDLNALVKRRVINTGQDASGGTFGVYSAAYARKRTKNNLDDKPFPTKNFKYTTRMWNNTTATVIQENADHVRIRIAPVQQFEIQKLQWNEEREGKPIIALNKQEEALLERSVKARYKRVLIKNNII